MFQLPAVLLISLLLAIVVVVALAARGIGGALPVAMLAAVVLTANHYLIDAVAGGAVALIGLILAQKLSGRRLALPQGMARST